MNATIVTFKNSRRPPISGYLSNGPIVAVIGGFRGADAARPRRAGDGPGVARAARLDVAPADVARAGS